MIALQKRELLEVRKRPYVGTTIGTRGTLQMLIHGPPKKHADTISAGGQFLQLELTTPQMLKQMLRDT